VRLKNLEFDLRGHTNKANPLIIISETGLFRVHHSSHLREGVFLWVTTRDSDVGLSVNQVSVSLALRTRVSVCLQNPRVKLRSGGVNTS
jgi:hypothetical protein